VSHYLQTVLALIDEAFAGTQRDEECTLHQAQLRDCIGDFEIAEEEWLHQKLRDPETNWRDVPAASLDECDAVLSHASPQSWLFYLPAYMKRALELLATNAEESYLPSSVVFHLTLQRRSAGLNFYVFERFQQITEAQERAIIAFLEYVRDYPQKRTWDAESATEALNSYWALPESKRFRGIEIAH
jgi:hypothetical protein